MRRHREKLVEFMEIRFGLPKELLRLGVFSQDDCDEINCEKFVVKKKEKLLDIILDRKDVKQLDNFRIALERTGQLHVLNYLDWNGGEFCNNLIGTIVIYASDDRRICR